MPNHLSERLLFFASFSLACLLMVVPAHGQTGVAFVGDEFRVNTYTNANQSFPRVAMAPDGRAVAVWESVGQDNDGDAVIAQRYDASGTAVGGEIMVNTTTTNHQSQASVVMAADASFVVFWRSQAQDGDGWGVYGQRFDAGGNTVGVEFRVNEETDENQELAFAALDDDGNMMVVWEGSDDSSGGVYGRVYDSAGVAGDEFRINTTTAGWQNDVKITAFSSGFLVTWESLNVDDDFRGVVYRRYAADGTPLEGEQLVNTTEAGNQNNPEVAVQPDDSFAVVWESDGQDGSEATVIIRFYTADGSPTSGEIQLNETTPGDQENLGMTADGRGGYFVVWDGDAVSGGSDDEVWGRRILPSGNFGGDEFRINTNITNRQVFPAVAGSDSGLMMVIWHSWTEDGSGTGVAAQRLLVTDLFSDDFESGDTSVWSLTVD